MKLLLDTHVFLWLRDGPEKLKPTVFKMVSDLENDLYLSAVTGWELAIKQSIGKLGLPAVLEDWLPTALEQMGIDPLSVTMEDALRVRALPWHHRDPFDRLLVAQAMGGYALVTHDSLLQRYPVEVIVA